MGALCVGLLASTAARAACCDVVKVDPESPTTTVRVCAPDAAGGCGQLLFEGTLSIGESQNVCVSGDEIVYQEWDGALPGYATPTTAVCQDQPVEI